MLNFTAPTQITISVATKDRPEILEATLQRIIEFGLRDCTLIICDDGSSPALNPSSLALFPNKKLLRNQTAQGQAASRNRIARECETPYLLQLDDDSYPVNGNLCKLLEYARSHSDWLAIAIPFEEPARKRGFPRTINDLPVQVKAFVGCSALINVSEFVRLNGYAEWIRGIAEEEELCLRALNNGLGVSSIDLIRVRHDVTKVGRNLDHILARSFRNWLLIWALHAPPTVLPWRLLRLTGAACLHAMQRNTCPLKGMLQGILEAPSLWAQRNPITTACYRKFIQLPHVLEFFER